MHVVDESCINILFPTCFINIHASLGRNWTNRLTDWLMDMDVYRLQSYPLTLLWWHSCPLQGRRWMFWLGQRSSSPWGDLLSSVQTLPLPRTSPGPACPVRTWPTSRFPVLLAWPEVYWPSTVASAPPPSPKYLWLMTCSPNISLHVSRDVMCFSAHITPGNLL